MKESVGERGSVGSRVFKSRILECILTIMQEVRVDHNTGRYVWCDFDEVLKKVGPTLE